MVRNQEQGHGDGETYCPSKTSGIMIHATSEVEARAVIGRGTKIWRNSHIRGGACIGRNCTLGQNVYIDEDVIIGDNVHIQNNVSVYKGVTIHNDVFVGPSVVFTNDLYPRAKSIREDWELVTTQVERGASIGAGAVIIAGVNIGAFAMIGAGAVVARQVPAYGLVMCSRATVVGFVDEGGRKCST